LATESPTVDKYFSCWCVKLIKRTVLELQQILFSPPDESQCTTLALTFH
jgi:hypothetical protein